MVKLYLKDKKYIDISFTSLLKIFALLNLSILGIYVIIIILMSLIFYAL